MTMKKRSSVNDCVPAGAGLVSSVPAAPSPGPPNHRLVGVPPGQVG